MSMQFRATAPEETDNVRAFLAGVFGIGLDAPALDPETVSWRFHAPRPDWTGSRSYVLERDGVYAAHGCVWPMPLATPEGAVTACQIVDWAGAREFPGAGLLLRRKIEELVAVSAGIGGSDDSRRIMPRSGYATAALFRRFVRVVRPLRQMMERRDGAVWKRAAKAVRNVAGRGALPKLPDGFSVEPAKSPMVFPGGAGYLSTVRSGELIAHLLRCPSARVTAWTIHRDAAPVGYFLLSEVHGQTRLADLRVADADWLTGVTAATRTAAELPGTCEIVADTSLDVLAEALGEAGYRPSGEQPVFIRDPGNKLRGRPLHITMADYDALCAWFPDGHFSG